MARAGAWSLVDIPHVKKLRRKLSVTVTKVTCSLLQYSQKLTKTSYPYKETF